MRASVWLQSAVAGTAGLSTAAPLAVPSVEMTHVLGDAGELLVRSGVSALRVLARVRVFRAARVRVWGECERVAAAGGSRPQRRGYCQPPPRAV